MHSFVTNKNVKWCPLIWATRYKNNIYIQESCAIAKMTARCALYISGWMSRCGDMAIRNYQRWRSAANLDLM